MADISGSIVGDFRAEGPDGPPAFETWLRPGMRVRVVRPVERFSLGKIYEPRLWGMVDRVEAASIGVKLEGDFPELAEWDGCLEWYPSDEPGNGDDRDRDLEPDDEDERREACAWLLAHGRPVQWNPQWGRAQWFDRELFDLMAERGFRPDHVGGGCSAWRRELGNVPYEGPYILLGTDGDCGEWAERGLPVWGATLFKGPELTGDEEYEGSPEGTLDEALAWASKVPG